MNGSETRELVVAHMRALRKTECCRESQFVLIPEDNLGNEAQEISETIIREIDNVKVLARTKTRYGVRTEAKTRRGPYVGRVADLLAHSAIRYHAPLISANPFTTNRTPEERATEARVEFEAQMGRFQNVQTLAASLAALPQSVMTGKADHEHKNSRSMKDDMVMALLLGIYHAGEYVAGHVDALDRASAHVRVNAPPIAPAVRHTEFAGGRPFAERARLAAPPSFVVATNASLEQRLAGE